MHRDHGEGVLNGFSRKTLVKRVHVTVGGNLLKSLKSELLKLV